MKEEKKPSERIIEIHRALKILDGQNPEEPIFDSLTFFEKSILQYLDELSGGTAIENRKRIQN